jgi:hypothetical protein
MNKLVLLTVFTLTIFVAITHGAELKTKEKTSNSCKSRVSLYEHDLSGRRYSFRRGSHSRVSSRINDKTSSIVVPSGCIVDIYEHTSYRGRKATLKAGTYRYSQFRRLFPNDRLSSLKVRDAKTATAAPPTAPACEYKCLPGDRKWEWDSAYRNCRTCRRYATKAACETALAESGHCGATSTVSETFSNLRVSAARNRPATFTLKTDILASSVVIQHLGGQVSCSGSGGYSNFGCGNNLIALLLTQSKRRVLPSTNVKGYKKTSHRHAHWYTLSGVSRRSKTMKWQLNKAQMLKAGTYQLWYNEDLTGGTESDNRGTAVYKVTITGSGPTPPKPSPPKPSPPKPSPPKPSPCGPYRSRS